MPLRRATVLPCLLLLAAGAGSGCGSSTARTAAVVSTETVTVPRTAPPAPPVHHPSAPAPAHSPVPTAPAGGTPAPADTSSTRVESSGPAFVHAPSSGSPAGVVRAHGFTPLDTSAAGGGTLGVVVGERAGEEQAFFFDSGRYIGTDTSTPSGSVQVVGHSDTSVTLSYGLYRPADAACCPSGGRRAVTFTLDNGQLAPDGPIPPSSAPGSSRR